MVDVSKLPCRFVTYSSIQKEDVLAKPSVGCSEDCERCGWNPEVQKVRLNRLYREKGWQR